ncbi:Crp/Fnr family transcriptional regulator [Sporomusa sp. KB1]|jgi:CRP/FNR family cyclic AMP-dependent transcriptional regulator|uniref:Crp/Fnr family transcriptional regulator n=1 Tax=Sporomusa sp. KB1 TaxID=943346 RepID=UPI00119DA006|nr:Crp/Fnr family transcriptional regulator [Sporomusa sp. KB1]TWH47912.1 CRP/FNR family cyclic AMP-dependent transcriptional regulator [Sporomusa sp. KB1]
MDIIKKYITAARDGTAQQWLSELLPLMPDELLQKSRLIERHKGNIMIRMGEAVESVYLLIDGEINIMNELPSGIIYSFAKLRAPGILGENESLANFPNYRATVVCETRCAFLYLSKHDFLTWMKKSPEALYRVTVQIIRKHAAQVTRDRTFLFATGETRLAYLLAKYYETKAANGICELNIPRSQLADEIGFCVKTVDRCVGKFKNLGMVGRRGMKITITDRQYRRLLDFNV